MAIGRVTFGRPPVIEAVLGVEFAPVENWGVEHFGLFWSTVRERFPKFQRQPANISQHGIIPQGVQFVNLPPIRAWLIDESDSRVLQIQENRFDYNWRERAPDTQYPLYARLRAEFASEWNHYGSFLTENGLQVPTPSFASVTFINHIVAGSGWQTAADIPKILRAWQNPELLVGTEVTPKFVNISAGYTLSNNNEIKFETQQGLRLSDQQSVLQLTITVGGIPNSSDLLSWFDQAEQQLVNGFTAFTTDYAQRELWKRID